MSFPQQIKDRFIAMRSACYSYDKISATLNISKPTLIKWGIQFKKQIAALECADAHALMEKYLFSRRTQLEDDLKELVKIKKAIKLKDYTKISITTLLEMERSREEKIGMRMETLQKNAELATSGLDKEVLSGCAEDPDGKIEGMIDNFIEKYKDKIRKVKALARYTPQDGATRLSTAICETVFENHDDSDIKVSGKKSEKTP